MDAALAQFPLHTATHILVLEMGPFSSLMLTVVAGRIVSVSVPRNSFQSFSACKAVCLDSFVAMVRSIRHFL